MNYEEEFDEDSMPCPCQQCGEWFDLHDGQRSEKWFPNTVICESCARDEEKEIERDNEIEELQISLDDALYTLRENIPLLKKLGVKYEINTETWVGISIPQP